MWRTWAAQSVSRLTLDCSSGHDLLVCGIELPVAFCADRAEPAWDFLSPVSAPPPPVFTCSLSLKTNIEIKVKKKKKKNWCLMAHDRPRCLFCLGFSFYKNRINISYSGGGGL